MGDYLTFGSVNSSTYGVYIFGESTYDAPKRDVESISIPGRNGTFLLDHNRFENIEVTYICYAYAITRAALTTTLDTFRNALKSQVGYQRLTDTFHTDEYRMGALIDDIEIDPILYNTSAKFRIKFNCKPQRFLTSGETATSVANNGTVTNPTLFAARPLIQFTASGAGTINLGSQSVSFISSDLGTIPLTLSTADGTASGYDPVSNVTISNTGDYNTGNALTFYGSGTKTSFLLIPPSGVQIKKNIMFSNQNGLNGNATIQNGNALILLTPTTASFTAGTSSTVTSTINITGYLSNNTSFSGTFTLYTTYNGSTQVQYKWLKPSITNFTWGSVSPKVSGNYTGKVYSTKNALSGTLYIDLDIGEAYRIQNNNVASINNYVNLGSELPTLAPGSTTITYSNTISNFKITPRWWRV